jgi:hypothetical protein
MSDELGALLSSPRAEMLDEHIGALLRIYEDAHVPDAKDRARVQEIATAFGERCLAAAKPPQQDSDPPYTMKALGSPKVQE